MATFCPARGAALPSVQDRPLPRVVGLVLVQGSVSLERLTSLELAIIGGGGWAFSILPCCSLLPRLRCRRPWGAAREVPSFSLRVMLSLRCFPLFIVEAVPVSELRLGALGPWPHRVVNDT